MATQLDADGMKAAVQQMRLVLMGTGSLTLDQVNRHAPGLTKAVVSAYLTESIGVMKPAGDLNGDAVQARKGLTDSEYLKALQLCRSVLDAHDSDDGGPTVAGSFLGELRDLLTDRNGASNA
jgi:hypothetical protein